MTGLCTRHIVQLLPLIKFKPDLNVHYVPDIHENVHNKSIGDPNMVPYHIWDGIPDCNQYPLGYPHSSWDNCTL